MKIPVHDDLVKEYVRRLLAREPLGKVFPCKLSECDFTPNQRKSINAAGKARKKADKAITQKVPSPILIPTKVEPAPLILAKPSNPKIVVPPVRPAKQQLSKLEKLLYVQNNRCFFCEEPLKSGEASIEHINPKSRGGTNDEDNLVICHKSLNQALGDMDLKAKLKFILKFAGKFKCP